VPCEQRRMRDEFLRLQEQLVAGSKFSADIFQFFHLATALDPATIVGSVPRLGYPGGGV
jgi:hypothetical protein